MSWQITFDPNKRDWTMRERGLKFEDAAEVFSGMTIDIEDLRFDYGEKRIKTVGHLRDRMVIVLWTPRGDTRHVISMRKANEREQRLYSDRLQRE
jgi:uncharacterized DUF497 family protein